MHFIAGFTEINAFSNQGKLRSNIHNGLSIINSSFNCTLQCKQCTLHSRPSFSSSWSWKLSLQGERAWLVRACSVYSSLLFLTPSTVRTELEGLSKSTSLNFSFIWSNSSSLWYTVKSHVKALGLCNFIRGFWVGLLMGGLYPWGM